MTDCGQQCWIVIVTAAAGFVLLFAVGVVLMLCLRKRSKRIADDHNGPEAALPVGGDAISNDVETTESVGMQPPTSISTSAFETRGHDF